MNALNQIRRFLQNEDGLTSVECAGAIATVMLLGFVRSGEAASFITNGVSQFVPVLATLLD